MTDGEQRCRLSKYGIAVLKPRNPDREGSCVKSAYPYCLSVRWDGPKNRNRRPIHRDFIEIIQEGLR